MTPIFAFNRRFRSLRAAWQEVSRPLGISYRKVVYNFDRGDLSIEDCLTTIPPRKSTCRPVIIDGKKHDTIAAACREIGVEPENFYRFMSTWRRRFKGDLSAAFHAYKEQIAHPRCLTYTFKDPVTVAGVRYESGRAAWLALSAPLGLSAVVVRKRFHGKTRKKDLIKVFTAPLRVTQKKEVQKNDK